MREGIAQYLTYNPRNKLIFTPTLDPHLRSVDVGYELASLIKDDIASRYLPMIAEEKLCQTLNKAVLNDEIIGDYIAISNWGILFEPELKLNLISLFDSFSQNQTLILVDCGEVKFDRHNLVSKPFGVRLPIDELSPYIISKS